MAGDVTAAAGLLLVLAAVLGLLVVVLGVVAGWYLQPGLEARSTRRRLERILRSDRRA